MAEIKKQITMLPNGTMLTTVIMEKDDYNELCDNLFSFVRKYSTNAHPIIDQMRSSNFSVSRNKEIEHVFLCYGIITDIACFTYRRPFTQAS